MLDSLFGIWSWLRANDIPNWLVAVLLPLAYHWYQSLRVHSIPGLDVLFSPGQASMNQRLCDVLFIRFRNNTSSTVYITNAKIAYCAYSFPAHAAADRDAAYTSYELKFGDSSGQFSLRQITVQTGQDAVSFVPLSAPVMPDFLSHAPGFRRFLPTWFPFSRKFFRLEFSAMVGDKSYSVSMSY
jgi:hypothetical protein